MKRIISAILCAILIIVSFACCKKSDNSDTNQSDLSSSDQSYYGDADQNDDDSSSDKNGQNSANVGDFYQCAHSNAKWKQTVAPTCAKEGTKIKKCPDCDKLLSTQSIAATGDHKYGQWVNNGDRTQTRICECGAKQTESLSLGANVEWRLDSKTGLLTISGTGKTFDYSGGEDINPLCQHRKEIKSIVIGDGITYLGNGLFKGLNYAVSVKFGKNVSAMGRETFYGCTKLTTVELNSGLAMLGESAFYNCIKLSQIDIPNTVRSIGNRAFKKSGLTGVNMPDSITTVGYEAFMDCAKLANADYSTNVSVLESRVFENCVNLKSFFVTKSISRIRSNAFAGCTALERITFENADNLRYTNYEATIASNAFNGCAPTLKMIASGGTVKKYADRYGFTFEAK